MFEADKGQFTKQWTKSAVYDKREMEAILKKKIDDEKVKYIKVEDIYDNIDNAVGRKHDRYFKKYADYESYQKHYIFQITELAIVGINSEIVDLTRNDRQSLLCCSYASNRVIRACGIANGIGTMSEDYSCSLATPHFRINCTWRLQVAVN